MIAAGPYSRACVAERPAVIVQASGSPAVSHVRIEERDGLVWVIGPDGISQPCSSPRVASLVAASVRNLGRA